MNWLEQLLGDGWSITPAGGSTGEAYYAKKQEGKRLFLKRNSSPFLAVLSAEGIVPKLVWTKRLESGDVITAQDWMDGRELEPEEMAHPRVAKLLSKIHHSKELLDMLMRLGKSPLSPTDILTDIVNDLSLTTSLKQYPEVNQALSYLETHCFNLDDSEYVVCHCDTNHNNWLLSSDEYLYLIDWDNAMVADPALDLGMLLYFYVPETHWKEWLTHYGIEPTEELFGRMKWYAISQLLSFIQWHEMRGESGEVRERVHLLKNIL
ncbi:phosphotransferase family protein [Salimicrobium halophilum]|uniref:Thiamine kinase n=1 Tax=Salimicrobium halophilum TaxID=86666 RepID=A0A1G8VN76_9BACI|nr:phosphotransferase family protein [Salimicrobium halophilum]SDJ66640.1 Thiamine kinase [Salimicrobium halophilum]